MTLSTVLRGIAWDHPRGYDALVAAGNMYSKPRQGIKIIWEKRSLQAFAEVPVVELATRFDLIVLDHPHMGEVARTDCLVPWDSLGREGDLAKLATGSIDGTHASYRFGGHQWALAVDAAAQVAAYRPDLIGPAPQTWDAVVRLAEEGRVLWPLKPVDALMSFFTIAANLGAPCAASNDLLIEQRAGFVVLDAMAAVSRCVPRKCLSMNPIEVLELLSSDSGYSYCPLLYGYSNYARKGFRSHLVRFANIPVAGDLGCRGSTLGGAGLGISVRCLAMDTAVDFVFFVGSAECQKGVYFANGGQPASLAAWEDEAVNAVSNNFFRDTRATLEQAWMRPRYAGYLTFQDRGGTILNAFLDGRLLASETLTRLGAVYRESLVGDTPAHA